MDGSIKHVRGVVRALDLLDQFLEQAEPMGAAEAGRATGMPRSTAYRLLITLESRGYLERHPDGDRFMLGPRLTSPRGRRAISAVVTLAQPVMNGLRDTCGETVGLHLLEGNDRVCVAAAEGVRSLRTSGRVGDRAPLYTGASARAIMAFLPPERQEEIIQKTGLAPLTPRTITDPAVLRAELAAIVSGGFAVSHGEWGEGITSIAAPIFDSAGGIGSVNISGPTFRFGPEKTHLLTSLVRTAGQEISRRIAEDEAGRKATS